VVGFAAPPTEALVDLRWLMAFSAGLGETAFPHPLFPVCYEWPATHELRERSGLQRFNARLVHAQHDLVIHRAPRAGDKLAIAAQVVSARSRKPGAYVVFRLEARDAAGAPVSTSDFGVLYRGVELEGGDRGAILEDPPASRNKLDPLGEIEIAATAAHVYTECARIWNPIHTDPAYARAAGLPGIILHGTATLALSVSRVLRFFDRHPESVRRVRCRFGGMVLMPSTLKVFALLSEKTICFETRDMQGKAVVERGRIDLLQ
jgi:acyl dehydratase